MHVPCGTVSTDLAAVDTATRRELASDVALVNQVSEYIIAGGGKRLRPLLVLLVARACGAAPLGPQVPAAVIIEFIHTATLLHDDVESMTVNVLAKKTRLPKDLLCMGIGWLAREDKLQFSETSEVIAVSLK